jgi:hypothetical protein
MNAEINKLQGKRARGIFVHSGKLHYRVLAYLEENKKGRRFNGNVPSPATAIRQHLSKAALMKRNGRLVQQLHLPLSCIFGDPLVG